MKTLTLKTSTETLTFKMIDDQGLDLVDEIRNLTEIAPYDPASRYRKWADPWERRAAEETVLRGNPRAKEPEGVICVYGP